MQRIKNAGQTLYNHKKKAIFASLVAAWGVNYVRHWIRDGDIRAYYARQALHQGEQLISAEDQPRRVTVLLNKSANGGSAIANFKQNALPLLHLAGIAVTVIKTEDAAQLRNLCAVLDRTEADGIFIVGGDGTLNNALAGLVERKSEYAPIPVGIFPGGRNNTALRALVPSVFRHTDDVRYQCESAMAVIDGTVKAVKPVRLDLVSVVPVEVEKPNEETGETEVTQLEHETVKQETIYTLGDITNGWFAYIDDRKWKFWYYGGFKRRFAYGWEMIKNSAAEVRTEIGLTDYCSGCNRCRTTKTEVVEKPTWRWWHALIGAPKPPKSDVTVKNYSQIVNEGCGRVTELCTQGTDVVISNEQHEDACGLRLRVGGTFAGRWGVARDGWNRTSEGLLTASAEHGFYTTDLIASQISMKFIEAPERLRKIFIAGDAKDFIPEKASVTIRPVEDSIYVFAPKSLRVGLEHLHDQK
uniref:DAGKc domain-containing protein n=1 Tax=Panagrellus redivivus TaxID=6233 RepID=A0A7E4UYH9_PANRE